MNPFFPEIKKKFGFGMMRLPMTGETVDLEQTSRMVDKFLEAGFNYFDTAHPYLQGQSETAVKACLTSRHPRESFVLADKLSTAYFQAEEDIRPLVEKQLELCGVDYFDFYLMHAMNAERHEKFLKTHAYDVVQQLKAEGKIHHVGFSFHDSPAVLEQMLTDRPEVEFVQLQLNYIDYDDPKVAARQCYEVCRRHGKPVIVMEPVKGGTLVKLPHAALELMQGASPASYAIRYAAGFDNVMMVLSGMSNDEQMDDNIRTMKDFRPLKEQEQEMIGRVRTIYQAQHQIPCTACHYCTDGCPAQIPIPELFAWANQKHLGESEPEQSYEQVMAEAGQCVHCGQCEDACPQHLSIRALLAQLDKEYRQ